MREKCSKNTLLLKSVTILGNFVAKLPNILTDFNRIEFGHKKLFRDSQFFSYRWCLEHLLKRHNLFQFVLYVKPLQNKISINNYETMFEHIMSECNAVVTRDKPSMTALWPAERRDDENELSDPLSSILSLLKCVHLS